MNFNRRTHTCGELRESNVDERVILNGWVQRRRDLGNLIFIDLRDRYGITQVVFESTNETTSYELAKKLRSEFVISIEGKVRKRPDSNPNMPTGMIDVLADQLIILNEAQTPPFQIDDEVEANEDLKLKYRYLDLRRNSMKQNILLRHKMSQVTRNYFDSRDFVEIETPVLMKSTPEGARDFLVPSRIHAGKFYALPQSPQTYKQLLMVSGFDRYFQIVKCFRDEDFRADRQPEFTQIDVEMSFIDQEEIFEVVEGFMKKLFKDINNYELQTPIPRLTFADAMEKYGSDKPDLRYDLEMKTVNDIAKNSGFKVFKDTVDGNGIVTALVAKGCAEYSRNQIDQLTAHVKNLGAAGLIWMKLKSDGLNSPIIKFLSDEEKNAIVERVNAESGDLIFIIAGPKTKALTAMGGLRIEIAKRENLINPGATPSLLWVTDFPLFEWDDETKRFYAMHHPFTSPMLEDVELLDTKPGNVRARAYDLVLNGNEVAGGSIRIHNSDLQAKMFNALGISAEEANAKFGFLMNAFKFGAPPHGGIAFGFDRLVMLFAGESSIREVIAFPKTTSGFSLMDESPSIVSEEQLKELHIKNR
ncbi:MAG: aspartate--tRNA ligase [Melioribacteraceae bacterium]|nr:aspartate--tRNA ligase [Melioribacteraceae bacterium]MCF8356097.1 aspartate--tRNA ligase [Melioribacteraceae bacterium]MCF8395581.1 aspartate--tRNA ligase [Melioribacteraceae bacterium]MCF8419683.1 aspartate--tRNA ligase [Melioribacteraceae bacterium]